MAKTAENVANIPVEKPKLTTERAIAEIRSLRAGGLFVGNMEFVDKLLVEYDKLLEGKKQLNKVAFEALNRLSEPSIVQEGVPS